MFGHIGCCTAVLTTKRQALQQTQQQEDDPGSVANLRISGQKAQCRSGEAHQQDGDEKRVFAADDVPQSAEKQGAERTHQKARRKRRKRRQQCDRRIAGRIKLADKKDRQHGEQIKVVPLEHRAKRRGENNSPLLCGAYLMTFFRCCHTCLLFRLNTRHTDKPVHYKTARTNSLQNHLGAPKAAITDGLG